MSGAAKKGPVEIVFDGPPGRESGRFLEVEQDGRSIEFGEWVEHSERGGWWVLRLSSTVAAAPELADVLLDADTLMQCDCTVAQRLSGHVSDCWLPHLRARIQAVLRKAGRLP